MSSAVIQPAFAAGEITPSLFGRSDLKQFHIGASTMKNFFVDYRGGARSRAGTAFIGRCKQSGTALPPRDIKFQFNIDQSYALEFGDQYMRVKSRGAYVTESPKQISGISQSQPADVSSLAHGFMNDDWVFLAGIVGMTELNSQAFIVANATADDFTLINLFGEDVNSLQYTAYSSGGTAARIYTLQTPWSAADLPLLKTAQSADVMTLVHPLYPPYDLTRLPDGSWSLEQTTFETSISAPASSSAVASDTAAPPTQYQYIVTAIDALTGEESVASPIATVTNSVDIAAVAGSIAISWATVDGAGSYNIYKAPPSYNNEVPVGSIFGFIGSALGLTYVDSNILPDYTATPPLHLNPFSPGQVVSFRITNAGAGYATAPTIAINTSTGSDGVFTPVVVGGAVQAIIVANPGHDYSSGDTVSITGGAGAGATAVVTIGATSGTYPGVVAYFQQRRVYADTLNNPDTYFMSQLGAYTNMDASQIPIASDAIIGTPWAQQVNGIQALVPMPGGLVVLTGLGAWQISGGQVLSAITPDNQVAQPQAYNGCSPYITPITINFDILYVQAKGAVVRDLSYDFFKNIYTGIDLSQMSSHLFTGYEVKQWAWCEEPQKIVWLVRDDGVLLSFTFSKDQEVAAWARHTTRGLVVSACAVSEPPVDALYLIVKRYISGQWLYYSERMNDRLWKNDVDRCWCSDSALSLPQPSPAATLQASATEGQGLIGSIDLIDGGSGYTSPACRIVDSTGSGAQVTATVFAGVITGFTIVSAGTGYVAPQLVVTDSTGVGCTAKPLVDNGVNFFTDADVFTSDNVGDIIRSGGGIAEITSIVSASQVIATINRPIVNVIPEYDEAEPAQPVPVSAGDWTMTTPKTELQGLLHLRGLSVAVLADGSVVSDLVVDNNGEIELPVAASNIVVGLGYVCELQSMYTDFQTTDTVQGKRKNIQDVTVRIEASRGVKIGSNQVDASTELNEIQSAAWSNMIEIKNRSAQIFAGNSIPLFTGDFIVNIPGSWRKPGQVALVQSYPLPADILAFIPDITVGDDDA